MPSLSRESSDTGTTEYLDLLYRARINIPAACTMAGMIPCEQSWEEMKILFREWCKGVPHNLEIYNGNMRN